MSLGGGTDAESLTASLRDLYATMDKGSTIPPIIMLQVIRLTLKIASTVMTMIMLKTKFSGCLFYLFNMLNFSHIFLPGSSQRFPSICRARRGRGLSATGRQRVLDGNPQNASGRNALPSILKNHLESGTNIGFQYELIRLQQKTSPTEQSSRANAVEQFMGIECTAETK